MRQTAQKNRRFPRFRICPQWMPHSGLPVSGGVRQCFWYHKTAIGHASGADVETDITWHGDRAAHFVNSMMSQGAVLIDSAGVVAMPSAES